MIAISLVNYTVDEHAKSDYEKLDGSQKQLILKVLKRIKERGIQAGEALRDKPKGSNKIKLKKQGSDRLS